MLNSVLLVFANKQDMVRSAMFSLKHLFYIVILSIGNVHGFWTPWIFCPESWFFCLSLVLLHVMLMNNWIWFIHMYTPANSHPESAAMPMSDLKIAAPPHLYFCNQLCFILNRRCQYVAFLFVLNIKVCRWDAFHIVNMNIHPWCYDSSISLCLSCYINGFFTLLLLTLVIRLLMQRGAMTPMEVCEGLGLYDLTNRIWHIQGTCALKGDGLYEGLDWLATTLDEMRASGRITSTSSSSSWNYM